MALILQQCTGASGTRVTLVRRTDCQEPPQPPTTHAQRSTALPLQRGSTARMHTAQRDTHTHTRNQPPTQSHAALRRHTAATARRGAPTHTRRHQSAIAILRYSTHITALDTSAGNARPTRALHIARKTQPRFFTFSRAQRVPPRACRPAPGPRSPLPSHHTRAQTHTTRQATPSTTARLHHGACHPKQRTPTSHAPHIAHTRMQNTDTQAPHAHTTSRTAPTTAHCVITTARTPPRTPPRTHHTQQGSQLRAPNTLPTVAQKITPSHTRPLRTTLTPVESACSASTECCRRVGWCTKSSPCRTHEQPSRHTPTTTTTQQQQTASECRKGRTCRTAT